MSVLAIDPGPTQSAYVVYDGHRPVKFGKVPNEEMRGIVMASHAYGHAIAIEMIAAYGMAVGAEVFETCVWIGRFIEAQANHKATLIKRLAVKMHHCHSARAKDGEIRQSIIDRFGGKEKAIGRKATPGPLYGVSNDVWQALALAMTWMEGQR